MTGQTDKGRRTTVDTLFCLVMVVIAPVVALAPAGIFLYFFATFGEK